MNKKVYFLLLGVFYFVGLSKVSYSAEICVYNEGLVEAYKEQLEQMTLGDVRKLVFDRCLRCRDFYEALTNPKYTTLYSEKERCVTYHSSRFSDTLSSIPVHYDWKNEKIDYENLFPEKIDGCKEKAKELDEKYLKDYFEYYTGKTHPN